MQGVESLSNGKKISRSGNLRFRPEDLAFIHKEAVGAGFHSNQEGFVKRGLSRI